MYIKSWQHTDQQSVYMQACCMKYSKFGNIDNLIFENLMPHKFKFLTKNYL